MAKTQIVNFKQAVPSKSGAYVSADNIDRYTPTPKVVTSKTDLRTKRSGK